MMNAKHQKSVFVFFMSCFTCYLFNHAYGWALSAVLIKP